MNQSCMRQRLSCASATLLMTLCLVSATNAQPPDNDTNSRPDNSGTGAYPAIKEEVDSLPAHVVYRPRDLAALGSQRLGVVA
jgi:hypothetical protein